jgi:pimeloyl-ACP methyl ester carboxylesterase
MRGDAVTAGWMKPVLSRREIRRDTVRVLRATAAKPDLMLDAAEGLRGFDRPALVVWASEDRVMPPEHGRRLAELLPLARRKCPAARRSSRSTSQCAWPR